MHSSSTASYDGELNDATDPDFFVIDTSNIEVTNRIPSPSDSEIVDMSPRDLANRVAVEKAELEQKSRHTKAIKEWMEDAPSSVPISPPEQKRKRKKDVFWGRRNRQIDTEQLQFGINELQFHEDSLSELSDSQQQSPPIQAMPISPRYYDDHPIDDHDDSSALHNSVRRSPRVRVKSGRLVKRVGVKSRIRVGYDVLHTAGLSLVTKMEHLVIEIALDRNSNTLI